MRITVKRSGGLANITRTAAVDTATLTADEAAELEAQVAAADLDHLPRVLRGQRGGGADRLQYDITVERDGKRWEIKADEEVMPSKLRELVDRVRTLARAK